MLKKLLRKLKSFFSRTGPASPLNPEIYPGKRADVNYGDKVGNVTIQTPAQLVKHTHFKSGEQYRLGEAIVTVHPDKASMLAAIAAVDAKRKAKEERLTERAINIMLMSPEELEQFKIEEFLASQRVKDTLFRRIMGRFWNKGKTNHFVQLEARYAELPKQAEAQPNDTKDKLKIVDKVSQ